MTELKSTREVIEELGGTRAVAALFGYTPKRVWSWQTSTFPAATYITLKVALEARGFTAPASLWGMKGARPAPSEAERVA